MKFLVDTQLPPSLAKYITGLGSHTTHTSFYPNGNLFSDRLIIKTAVEEDRIIITKDSDFFNHFVLKGHPPKILLIQLGNVSNPNLFDLVTTSWQVVLNNFENEAGLIIIGKNSITIY